MVDALREAWRVLGGGGRILDLRPCSGRFPIEVVASGGAYHIGAFEGFGKARVDRAAEGAVRQMIDGGWLTHQGSRRFEVSNYWDTVEEIELFIKEEGRIQGVTPPFEELERSYQALRARIAAKSRIRYRQPMMLGVYERAAGRAAA